MQATEARRVRMWTIYNLFLVRFTIKQYIFSIRKNISRRYRIIKLRLGKKYLISRESLNNSQVIISLLPGYRQCLLECRGMDKRKTWFARLSNERERYD